MSIYEFYENNAELEEKGVWIDTISDPEQFKIASSTNKKYVKEIRRLYTPHRNEIRRSQRLVDQGKDVPDALAKLISDLEMRAFCKCVLLDWKNVTDRVGKEIKYSPSAAFKLLSDPNLRALKETIILESDKHSNFILDKKDEEIEETEKNLKKTSTGS